jgi:hypothetical protein
MTLERKRECIRVYGNLVLSKKRSMACQDQKTTAEQQGDEKSGFGQLKAPEGCFEFSG